MGPFFKNDNVIDLYFEIYGDAIKDRIKNTEQKGLYQKAIRDLKKSMDN